MERGTDIVVNIVSPIKLRIKFKKIKEFVKIPTRTNHPMKSLGQNSGLVA